MLGPVAAKFLDADRWGSAAPEQMGAITLVRFSTCTQAFVYWFAGRRKSRYRSSTCYCRLSASCQVPTERMGPDDGLFVACHDNNVAIHNWVHPAHCAKTHSRTSLYIILPS